MSAIGSSCSSSQQKWASCGTSGCVNRRSFTLRPPQSGSSLSVVGPAVRRWIPDPLLDDSDQTECTVVNQAAAFWSIYTPPLLLNLIQQNLSLKFKGFISSYTYVALKNHIQFCICHIFTHFILFSPFLKSLDFAGVCFWKPQKWLAGGSKVSGWLSCPFFSVSHWSNDIIGITRMKLVPSDLLIKNRKAETQMSSGILGLVK